MAGVVDVGTADVVDVGTADVDHLAWPGWLRQGKFDPRYCYRYRCAGVEAKKQQSWKCGPTSKDTASRILVNSGSKSKVPMAGFSGRRAPDRPP